MPVSYTHLDVYKRQYRLSVGYMYDDSNLKWGNNNNQRFNLRLTNKLKVFDNFSIESVIAYNRQDQVAPSQLNRTLTSSYPQPGLPASTIDGKPYSDVYKRQPVCCSR